METDALLVEYPAMSLIKHPYRLLVIGQSQSGKTTMGVKCIRHLLTQVDETYVVSPTYEFQDTWKPIRRKVTLHHDNPETVFNALYKTIKSSIGDEDHKIGTKIQKRRLLICDDVSYEKALNQGGKGLLNAFAYNAVWWNLSIVTIIHKSSNIGAGMKENCDGLIIFNVMAKEMKPLFDTFGITSTIGQFRKLIHMMIKDQLSKNPESYPFLFYVPKSNKVYYKMQFELQINDSE